MVYVHESLRVREVSFCHENKFQMIRIHFEEFDLCSLYRSPIQSERSSFCQNLFDTIQTMRQRAVICGNFNPSTLNLDFNDEMKMLNFKQEIKKSTHDKGGILDYFFSRSVVINQIFHQHLHFTDHDAVFVEFTLN